MKHINTLEARLGITLFKRSKTGLTLTPAGQALFKDGKKLRTAAATALSHAKNPLTRKALPSASAARF